MFLGLFIFNYIPTYDDTSVTCAFYGCGNSQKHSQLQRTADKHDGSLQNCTVSHFSHSRKSHTCH